MIRSADDLAGELVHVMRPALLGDALVSDPEEQTWPAFGDAPAYTEHVVTVESAEGRRWLITIEPLLSVSGR